jgi:hypothetical protein
MKLGGADSRRSGVWKVIVRLVTLPHRSKNYKGCSITLKAATAKFSETSGNLYSCTAPTPKDELKASSEGLRIGITGNENINKDERGELFSLRAEV